MDEHLPSLDIEFLQSKGFNYEIKSFNEKFHLIIKAFPIPNQHYNVTVADMLIEIPAGYPNTPLDMFWTNPNILLNSGSIPVRTEHRETFHNIEWQRWSRHGAWRPGVDSLKTFIKTIQVELNKGV